MEKNVIPALDWEQSHALQREKPEFMLNSHERDYKMFERMVLAGAAQWIEHEPVNQGLPVQFPVRAHTWAHKRQPHIDASLPLFLPPFSSV